MKNLKRTLSILICMILLLSSQAFAFTPIDLNKDVSFTISYMDGVLPITGAKFDLYKVASTDVYTHMRVTGEFEPYDVVLENLDQDGWNALAMRLEPLAQRDLTPMLSATTDSMGNAEFVVKAGLYLVVPNLAQANEKRYISDPFIVFLPGEIGVGDDWNYTVTAKPKNTESTPIYKLLKIWDPEFPDAWKDKTQLKVDVYCDGDLYKSVTLTKANSWRYEFDEPLDPSHKWTFSEESVPYFTPVLSQEGYTYTITNKYNPEAVKMSLPILKQVSGSPATKSDFTFVLKANSADYPMPTGSTGDTKKIVINGEGTGEFGEITFEKPGTYTYTVTEEKGSVSGYTYDTAVYTAKFTVASHDNGYTYDVNLELTDAKGQVVDKIIFTNKYSTGGGNLPQTGMLWWPIPVLFGAGLLMLLLGVLRRKSR